MVRLVRFDDPDATPADFDTYLLVVEKSRAFGVDPSMSIEAEQFFEDLLGKYEEVPEQLDTWLEKQLPQLFRAIDKRPDWIQGPQWPFSQGTPMIFVGQIDLSIQRAAALADIFHDDTSLYVFVSKEGHPKIVIQQY